MGLSRRGGEGPRVSLSGGVCRASFPPLSQACGGPGWAGAEDQWRLTRTGGPRRWREYPATVPQRQSQAGAPCSQFLLSARSTLRAEHQNGGGAGRLERSADTAPRRRAADPAAGRWKRRGGRAAEGRAVWACLRERGPALGEAAAQGVVPRPEGRGG